MSYTLKTLDPDTGEWIVKVEDDKARELLEALGVTRNLHAVLDRGGEIKMPLSDPTPEAMAYWQGQDCQVVAARFEGPEPLP